MPDTIPPARFLLYGRQGYRKSTFAATFPRPLLVYSLDPYDKAQCYRDLGTEVITKDSTTEEVWDKEDFIAEIHYFDETTESTTGIPSAYLRFEREMKTLMKTQAPDFATIIFDSYTAFDTRFRAHIYATRGADKDPRKMYAESAEATERYFMGYVIGFRNHNVILIMHERIVAEDHAGQQLIGPAAYGQNGDKLAGFWGEIYHLTFKRSSGKEKGSILAVPQPDGGCLATSTRYKLRTPFTPTYTDLCAAYTIAQADWNAEKAAKK